ncbi:hypothetical protein P4637_08510 [Halalkalibacterium halodurans]|uniref:BH4034 protein n=2 Tax=Halalkalibacterium halodurans TaxID=86665 RepID=Q9K5Q4_HALH5|nr:hypothetical protein [Halalkalibacterium halodurans]MED3646615.1 hypothetical protein [Halalkalibacterium halodurans]MED4081061.1 hypothetical protein [Halalkalibacterium halodurans]MED4084875.1 hypothetical protein [Halalkalibacterium halodurans]MED4103467.1 hypothetical protein [Halalkalibacterium halodurans]MED4107757.1 hypothetical protein [Halalkalibacterium halodurans]
MKILTFIDPYLLQLYIVPFVVISVGVLAAIVTKKVRIAPVVTLVLNALYEFTKHQLFYSESPFQFTSWNLIFPTFSLFITSFIFLVKKANGGHHRK